MDNKNLRLNASGCVDTTAYKAIRNIQEDNKFHKLLNEIFNLCDEAGFRIEGRIVLVSKKTGRKWK